MCVAFEYQSRRISASLCTTNAAVGAGTADSRAPAGFCSSLRGEIIRSPRERGKKRNPENSDLSDAVWTGPTAPQSGLTSLQGLTKTKHLTLCLTLFVGPHFISGRPGTILGRSTARNPNKNQRFLYRVMSSSNRRWQPINWLFSAETRGSCHLTLFSFNS